MSIQGYVVELQRLKIELKNLNTKRRVLLKQVKDIEAKISAFLKEKDQPGVKYQGTAIILEQKEKPVKKKNKDRDSDAISVLKNYGIDDAENVFKKLMEARKGALEVKETLKITNLK